MRHQHNCQHADETARHPEHNHRRHGMRKHGRGGAPELGGHRGTDHGHPGRNERRRPTLGRSILKSARRIRRADLSPDQLHRRIAGSVSHADYMITMRTLRTISKAVREPSR